MFTPINPPESSTPPPAEPVIAPLNPKRTERPYDPRLVLVVLGTVGVLFAGLLAAVVVFAQQSPTTAGLPEANATVPPSRVMSNLVTGLPVIGSPEAKVLLVEFMNFGCSHCKNYAPVINTIIKEQVDTGKARLAMVTLFFDVEDASFFAANVAICADQQGGYWKMHDALYELQGRQGLSWAVIEEIVTARDLDFPKLQSCVTEQKAFPVLESGLSMAKSAKISGTPTLMYSLDGGVTLHYFKVNGQDFPSGVTAQMVAELIAQNP